jgi:hypothetical protein
MVANHPNMASVSYMSAASSDLFFAVQQGLQVHKYSFYPKMESVSYMSAVSSDLFFAIHQGLQVPYVLFFIPIWRLSASCQLPGTYLFED